MRVIQAILATPNKDEKQSTERLMTIRILTQTEDPFPEHQYRVGVQSWHPGQEIPNQGETAARDQYRPDHEIQTRNDPNFSEIPEGEIVPDHSSVARTALR